MNALQVLTNNRDALLIAEAGAFIHNIGKMGSIFLEYQRDENQNYAYQAIVGLFAGWAEKHQDELTKDERNVFKDYIDKSHKPVTYQFLDDTTKALFKERLLHLPLPFNKRPYAIGEFIEFQNYGRWYNPFNKKGNLKSQGSGKQILARHDPEQYPDLSASELLEAVHHVASGEEKEVFRAEKQLTAPTYISSAFEYEKEIDENKLDRDRKTLLEKFKIYIDELRSDRDTGKKADMRSEFYALAKNLMVTSIADTQRPINDVTLWDISHSVASLYKSALAAFILTGTMWSSTPHDNISWRYLLVSVGGTAFWNRADRIPDLIGRRASLNNALDQVRRLLEFEIPMGNEIYRDESGSLFTVPDLDGLLTMKSDENQDLREKILAFFKNDDLHAELGIHVDIGKDLLTGKHTHICETLDKRITDLAPRPECIELYWQDDVRPGNAQICPVCGIRPAGGPYLDLGRSFMHWASHEKAAERGICRFCLQRRSRRAQEWSCNHALRQTETIWIDEAADANQRLVLLAGHFDLNGWIKGEHIETLGKPPTFARTRRCWDTTYTFWHEIKEQTLLLALKDQLGWRLTIHPAETNKIKDGALGNWFTYETDVGGQRIPLCWHPAQGSAKGFFRTCANLKHVDFESLRKKTRNRKKAVKALFNQKLSIYSAGKQRHRQKEPIIVLNGCVAADIEEYFPLIPLMIEPSSFMVLLPAATGLEAINLINEKYQREICKVKDNLPLKLGAVYFPKRTPVRAVIEAGRRMIVQKGMKSSFDFEYLDTANRRHNIRYDDSGRRCTLPCRPYGLEAILRHQKIWSTFSRLAISQQYQIIQRIEGKRDDWFGRRFSNAYLNDRVFQQFVFDTLNGAQWPGHWNTLSQEDRQIIVNAGVSGELADIFELYHSITST
ncbi:putative CRISPR-associated protein [Desulfosarcina variabilis str. Montpellier]|uniref:hypothetical protein n=1 Tax=Desulfosarcina variabilis TaxID=2300 RepID=UPI003AFA6968